MHPHFCPAPCVNSPVFSFAQVRKDTVRASVVFAERTDLRELGLASVSGQHLAVISSLGCLHVLRSVTAKQCK